MIAIRFINRRLACIIRAQDARQFICRHATCASVCSTSAISSIANCSWRLRATNWLLVYSIYLLFANKRWRLISLFWVEYWAGKTRSETVIALATAGLKSWSSGGHNCLLSSHDDPFQLISALIFLLIMFRCQCTNVNLSNQLAKRFSCFWM